MDPGLRTPLVDFFRRGEVAREVRLQAAQGALAPRAHEQLGLLVLLSDDTDAEIAGAAKATIAALPAAAVSAFLGRGDVPDEMKTFFSARGIQPDPAAAAADDAPLVDTGGEVVTPPAENEEDVRRSLSSLPVIERMKLAMKGSREQRAQLVRDPNKLVSSAVLSSPKLTDAEVESFTRMGNVSEDVLRVIGTNRAWTKNYGVVSGLCRNPKTPPAVSMQMVNRLTERDLKMLSIDRNIPEALRALTRKLVTKSKHG
jgi:hypothetical protein